MEVEIVQKISLSEKSKQFLQFIKINKKDKQSKNKGLQNLVCLLIFGSLMLSTSAQISFPFIQKSNAGIMEAYMNFTFGSCVIKVSLELETGGTLIGGDSDCPTFTNTISSKNFQMIVNYGQEKLVSSETPMGLCLGGIDDHQVNLVKQLYDLRMISQQRVLIYGEINIEEPKQQLIKNDSSLVKMLYIEHPYVTYWTLHSNGEMTLFGDIPYGNQDRIIIDKKCFDQLLKILEKHNYKITKQVDIYSFIDSFDYYLDTIKGLEPIYITLLTADKSPYILRINQSQYTQEIDKGLYQLAIHPPNTPTSVLQQINFRILDSYYMGQDINSLNVFIAERCDDLNPQEVSQNEQNFAQNLRTQNI